MLWSLSFFKFWFSERNTENTVSDLYFNEGNGYSEETQVAMKALNAVGTLNFEILVEDSDTYESSSITVRMEYVFVFQLWYCELCVQNRWKGGRKHCYVIFVL